MKKILGLDLGTNSIGWAVVNESENNDEQSSIIKLGVRVNPLTVDETTNFEKGKSITTNADRTLKRSMRRNLQRYKLRRENLIEILKREGFINDETILSEHGNATTFETYRLRAKAATQEISLSEFARVLLMINKKRGYKSSRKAKDTEEGQLIDGMTVAVEMYDKHLTPGQYVYNRFESGKLYVPDFYRSDLQAEFDKIWNYQKTFNPDLFSDELKEKLVGKNKTQTWGVCKSPWNLVGIKRETKGIEQKKENYRWRCEALENQLGLEELAVVLQEINGQISGSSGYLGNISDRSKELYFNQQTVGQYQLSKLEENPHYSLKNQVFYRQDYLDEFEKIWEVQAKYHKCLTDELKEEIRDVVIFYQRRLKSQKGLISICEFEGKEIELDGKKKIVGPRVCPKSSPLFQEFKILQILNNITVKGSKSKKKVKRETEADLFSGTEFEDFSKGRYLYQEERDWLFKELNIREKMSAAEVVKLLFGNGGNLELNFREIEGNRTQAELFKAYSTIIERSGHDVVDFSKMSADSALQTLRQIFEGLGFKTDFLTFDSLLQGDEFEKQPFYRLWHLLYSFEGDNSATGDENLVKKISDLCGMPEEYARIIANVTFKDDYGSLSTRAIRKIMPYLRDGNEYSLACEYAGYRHSKQSLTKEEIENKVYRDRLEILPKNSLRNPVVEKILNQMVHVVNGVVETYGKPDEIRIELARELKKSAKEREEMTKNIAETTRVYERYKEILKKEFGMENVSRNDIIRYKLYEELASNGYKTLYSDTYIPREELFSKKFDIEHIIPQAKLFDDSFSNKTIESRQVNIEKSNATAFDFVKDKYGEQKLEQYRERVENLFKNGVISKGKYKKLLMSEADIPSDFINRDLNDSQYIAKKARQMLNELVPFVVSTTGSITDRLREDWQLVDVMKELNWEKYKALDMVEYYQDKDGRQIGRIKDWTKRNDHRHHAMDALTIAFTKRSYIQYLNNLNARIGKSVDDYVDLAEYDFSKLSKEEKRTAVYSIEKKELYRNDKGKLLFIPPMPLDQFRAEAKRQLENILVSIKAKNKVTTNNVNKAKNKVTSEIVTSDGEVKQIKGQTVKTPRGQLHNETVYGSSKYYDTNDEKVNATFDADKIAFVADKNYREALLVRLLQFEGDAKKVFTGKNALDKNPIWLDEIHSHCVPVKVKLVHFEQRFTIRKPITPDLKIDKVVDKHIRQILEQRLQKFGNDPKKAFSNLEETPIWLNEEKGIAIKRVTITGISNGEPLHEKRDKDGNFILDKDGKKIPTDYVSTSNNHHVAIYRDAEGNLQENVVSFYEAVARVNSGLPIIDKEYKKDEGWTFLFTMKQNEYFVFPNKETGFDPKEIDLTNPDNYSLISPNLFRVQKIATKNYFFRHHLETTVDNVDKVLRHITWELIQTPNKLEGIVKVRVNHLGQIVSVGEY